MSFRTQSLLVDKQSGLPLIEAMIEVETNRLVKINMYVFDPDYRLQIERTREDINDDFVMEKYRNKEGITISHGKHRLISVSSEYKFIVAEGLRINYYDSGEIYSETSCFNFRADGKKKILNKDKSIRSITNYQNGVKNGPAIEYFSNGTIYRTMNYKSGLLDGNFVNYDKDGFLLDIYVYKYGMKNGTHQAFYKNGLVRLIEYYQDDKLDGKYISFDQEGEIIEEFEYEDDKICKKRKH